MTELSGYVLVETLREGGEFTLYRGWQHGNPLPVLVLTPVAEQPTPASLTQLEHEYSLAAELDADWAARPLSLARHEGRMMLVLEDPGGEPLDRLLGKPMELRPFLRRAIGLSAALGRVHERGLVHKDIKPAHVLALVIEDGHRAGEIIKRIRSFAKKTPSEKDWIDINQTIREVIALARSEVQRNNVALETRLSDDVHYLPLILADRVQLQQVILNLMMNDVEAMNPVTDRPREMLIRSSEHESDKVLVAVQDSGVGIDAQDIEKIFGRFLHNEVAGHGHGIGYLPLDCRGAWRPALGDSQ